MALRYGGARPHRASRRFPDACEGGAITIHREDLAKDVRRAGQVLDGTPVLAIVPPSAPASQDQESVSMYHSLQDAIRDATSHGISLSSIALDVEAREQGRPVSEIQGELGRAIVLVRSALAQGVHGDCVPASGILSGDAALLR